MLLVLFIPMLHEFLTTHHDEIVRRARVKVAARFAPRATPEELETGVPLFLSQLEGVLRSDESPLGGENRAMNEGAATHGGALYRSGFTIAQVVQGYGDVCQVVTELASERQSSISILEFHAFNWCLDHATAEAVTEYQRQREATVAKDEVHRLGTLVHELRNSLSSARLAFELLKDGQVSVTGSTSQSLGRSLARIGELIDRSLTDVRLSSGIRTICPVRLAGFVEDVEIDATIQAKARGMRLSVPPVDPALAILADSQLLAAAVTNLVQNAFKFTRVDGQISITTSATADWVRIHVADECGGLPEGKVEDLFRPFEQHRPDRSGLGLGLGIVRRAAEAHGGAVRVENRPGLGCTFTLEVPRAPFDTNASETV